MAQTKSGPERTARHLVSSHLPKWGARRNLGLPNLHFHDLRHVVNTLTAASGASTRELMHRMGHVSPAAELRYQHATRDRDAAIRRARRSLAPKPATVITLRPRLAAVIDRRGEAAGQAPGGWY